MTLCSQVVRGQDYLQPGFQKKGFFVVRVSEKENPFAVRFAEEETHNSQVVRSQDSLQPGCQGQDF